MRKLYIGAMLGRALGLVLALAAPGCAYYNTFYLAKKHYKEAEKAQEKSLSDLPSPDASAKYDLAIRQCTKVVTQYPKSKWMDDASYMLGAALYGKGDYQGAMQHLDDFAVKFPKSPFIPDARFTEGLARYRQKEYTTADSIFREVDTKYPKFSRRWELCYYAGENAAGVKGYPAALYWYGRALGAANERHERSNTLRRAGDICQLAGRPDTAEVLYAQCLKVEDRGKERLDVALSRAECLRDLKHYAQAVEFLGQWKVFSQQENREGELLLLANECTALMGHVPEAITGYRNVVTKFQHTIPAYDAQFRIGYLYETKLQDYNAAGTEYDKLKNEPTSEFSTQAARRSQNLSVMKQYQKEMATDTTDTRAKAAFLLAELYYFQLGKPDSAITQYRSVEYTYPHSIFAPKSAYARLWISAFDRSDTLGVMALTDTIADRYRGTRYAESALYLWKSWAGRTDSRTALLDSLIANPDTSRTTQFEPEPTLNLPAPVDSGQVVTQGPQGYAMTHADSVRADSLLHIWQQTHKNTDQKLPKGVRAVQSGNQPAPGTTPSGQGASPGTTPGTTPGTSGGLPATIPVPHQQQPGGNSAPPDTSGDEPDE